MQARLLFKVLTVALVAMGLVVIVFYYYANQEIGQSYKQFHTNARNFLDILMPVIAIAAVTGVVAALALAILIPLKIVGPLHRMERLLREEVALGDLTLRFSVRKHDEMAELAEVLNTTFEGIGAKVKEAKSASTELQKLCQEGDPSKEKLLEAAKKVDEALRALKT